MVQQRGLCNCYRNGWYSREGCVTVTGLGGTAIGLCYCYRTGWYSREGCVTVTGLGGTADRVVLLLHDWIVQR